MGINQANNLGLIAVLSTMEEEAFSARVRLNLATCLWAILLAIKMKPTKYNCSILHWWVQRRPGPGRAWSKIVGMANSDVTSVELQAMLSLSEVMPLSLKLNGKQ